MLAPLHRAAAHSWTVITRAWADTISFCGWSWRTVTLVVLPGVVAFVFAVLIPGADGFTEYLRSGFFGLIISLSVFALIFATNLMVIPSLIDQELRQQIEAHLAHVQERDDAEEVARFLQERYDIGSAIGSGRHNLDYKRARAAWQWHQKNLKLFEQLLPEHEFFMYKTIAPDPESKGSRLRLPFQSMQYIELHNARLGKLRLIVGRLLESATGPAQ